MSNKTPDYTFKILLLGDGGVGKTSLVRRFVHDKFTKEYLHTIGMQPSQKYLTINQKYVCLSIVDIAGEQSFKRLREMFYRGSRGALVTFDLTSKSSFDNVKNWHKEAKSKAKGQLFVLVGNKNDLSERQIQTKEAEDLAKKLKFIDYIETSALTGDFVDEAFNLLGQNVLEATLRM